MTKLSRRSFVQLVAGVPAASLIPMAELFPDAKVVKVTEGASTKADAMVKLSPGRRIYSAPIHLEPGDVVHLHVDKTGPVNDTLTIDLYASLDGKTFPRCPEWTYVLGGAEGVWFTAQNRLAYRVGLFTASPDLLAGVWARVGHVDLEGSRWNSEEQLTGRRPGDPW